MNINSIKALSWLVSAALTAGLGYYVYDFREKEPELTARRITPEEARAILDSAVIPEGPKSSLVEIGAIQRAFYFNPRDKNLPNLLDWTGAKPVVIVEAAPEVVEPPKPTIKPLKDSVAVQMIREAMGDEIRSEAWISYKPASGVQVKADAFLSRIGVGDKLATPLDGVTVVAISAKDGITFSFEEEGREDETVRGARFDTGVDIYVVDGDNPEKTAKKNKVPTLESAMFRPEHTTLIGKDKYRIGSEDALDFSNDFGGILAREVKHKRHYDPKTRKYDGIELTEVKPGGRIAAHGGQSGDIIKSVNGHAVSSLSEAITWGKNNQDKYTQWIVIIENKGKQRTMIFDNPPNDE
jgi:hypothetical protein